MIINCTPHPICFRTPTGDMIVEKSGYTLAARPVEEAVGTHHGVALVRTVFQPTAQGWEEIAALEAAHPDAIIVGSIISAQAYPGRVLALVPVPGTERAAPADKVYCSDKFTVF